MGPVYGDMGGCYGDMTGCEGDMGPMMGDCSMVTGDMAGCEGDMTNIAGDMGPVTGDMSPIMGDMTGCEGDMGGCSGDMTGITGDMGPMTGDMTDMSGPVVDIDVDVVPPLVPALPMPPTPDAFDTANPDFGSPEMTEARAEVNDAAAMNDQGQIEVAPDMANPAHDMAPVAPDMSAGTPAGAAEMSAAGGGEAGGMGAMDDVFAGQPDTAAPMDINPADAALGAAMDSAMDQGGAPAGNGPGITQEAMDDPGFVDPGQDDDQSSDDDGGMAG
jgi:hypothetical protein